MGKSFYHSLYRIAQQIVKFAKLENGTDDGIDWYYYHSCRESLYKSFNAICELYGIEPLPLLHKMILNII